MDEPVAVVQAMSWGNAIRNDRRLDVIFKAHYTFRNGLIFTVESTQLGDLT